EFGNVGNELLCSAAVTLNISQHCGQGRRISSVDGNPCAFSREEASDCCAYSTARSGNECHSVRQYVHDLPPGPTRIPSRPILRFELRNAARREARQSYQEP